MKNKYTFLRHAETIKDPNKPAPEWDLTPDALEKINQYISEGKFDKITKIYSSTEPKAVATGKPISTFLDLPILEMEEFVELKREKKFLTDEEFLDQKKRELTNLDHVENGVESGNTGIERFESGIQKLEDMYTGENILIITHGTIMTLYLAKINNDNENIFENFNKLKFCELVEIINYKV
jgi:broad specificity phosphatase PhoE